MANMVEKPIKKLKILSFNWHEPYLCLLAKTWHELFVFEPVMSEGVYRRWDARFRAIPANLKIVSEREMNQGLDEGSFDLVICQNVKDLMLVAKWPKTPKILVFHNKLTTEIALGGNAVDRIAYLKQIKPLLKGVHSVFISQSKKDDWGLEGDVILPGIPVEEYGGYTGEIKTVLRIGNRLMERDLMLGFTEQEQICEGLPSTVLGDNPRLQGCRMSNSADDLKTHFQKCRVYLNTTKHPYEDGYNLSLLEAMATGMPVLSLANPSSPITDGKEGFINDDLEKLKNSARLLLEDHVLAKAMGESARKTVADKFPMSTFISRWQAAIETAASGRANIEVRNDFKRANVWIDYAYYPATTAHYLRRAFAKSANLIASGASMPQEVIKLWNLENMKAPLLGQDVPRLLARDALAIMERFPVGYSPDFFLWVETGLDGPPTGLERLTIPKAAYFIDTHLHTAQHIAAARAFDCVFLAQREYIGEFQRNGIMNVHWLPLACDPEIHGKKDVPKKYDIGFAGSITQSHQRRAALLAELQKRFNVQVSRVFLEEMAELYSASKIVFNNAIRDDLNMRVFEALCSGSLLLTDAAAGLEEFFTDGKHLAVYNDGNILEKAAWWLAHDEEREAVARAGREEVLKRHTYAHRADTIVQVMRETRESITLSGGKPKSYFRNVRPEIIEMVPPTAKRILEIGCAAGETGRALKEADPRREVVGVEFDRQAAREAEKLLDHVFCADIEKFRIPYPEGYFDCIIYADVLEHLREPSAVITRHKRLLGPEGVMVMSIPNVRHVSVVAQLMEGRWTYQEEGLLDKTHLRFFTLAEVKEMLEQCGMTTLLVQGKRADTIYREGAKGTLKAGRWQIENLTESEMLDFFVFQYLVLATPDRSATDAADDPASLEHYRRLIAESEVFRVESDDPFIMAGAEIAALNTLESPGIAARLDALDESRAQRLLWVGHFNMALGRFEAARGAYARAASPKYEGCASAAMGDMLAALRKWCAAEGDKQAEEWLDRYTLANGSPVLTAVLAAEEGEGARRLPGDAWDFKSGMDFITSFHRLEEEEDVVGALQKARDALRPGGVLAMVCASRSASGIYPSPMHRFSGEGMQKLLSLVGGLGGVRVIELLPGRIFVAICQKEGGAPFDYEKRFNAMLSSAALMRAQEYWDAKMIVAAGDCARVAVMYGPDNSPALARLADCLLKRGQSGEAESLYRRALELAPSEGALVGLGTLYLGKNDFTAAEDFFVRAVKAHPQNDRAMCGLGMARFHAGKQREGFACYQEALSLNPDNGLALSALVQAAYHLKDFTAAETAVSAFLEFHPANLDMLFALAGIQYAQGKFAEAKDALDKIMLFDPKREDALMLYEKLAETVHAK
ncbi:MAG: glycosyltransferase [Nitrospinae bacterium]|nr:glycosyltransferase [Nitrospinota bacterium]